MERVVSLLKTFKAQNFRKFYKLFFLLVSLLTTLIIAESILAEKGEKYNLIMPKLSYVKFLKSNDDRLTFIQNHNLENSSNLTEQFQNLLNDFSKKYRIIVKYNDIKNNSVINELKTETRDILLLSWHDSYIFELIEKMEKLSPGFIKIEKVNITRISNINTDSPALKVQILCKLYYKP